MAVALMSVISVNQDAFASESGMSVTATATEGGNIISVTGSTTSSQGDVAFTVTTPDDFNLQTIGQETPDANCEFSVEFNVSINPKPVISLLIESSFSDVIFFSPICTDAGHAGFRLSIP